MEGRSRRSVPSLPAIKPDRLKAAKVLVEKAVKVKHCYKPNSHFTTSIYSVNFRSDCDASRLPFSAEESVFSAGALPCDPRCLMGQRVGGVSSAPSGPESTSLPWWWGGGWRWGRRRGWFSWWDKEFYQKGKLFISCSCDSHLQCYFFINTKSHKYMAFILSKRKWTNKTCVAVKAERAGVDVRAYVTGAVDPHTWWMMSVYHITGL